MTISLDRSVCCDLNETISREWLVTNGLGGYAAGTVAGVLTRTQHGLLVAMSPNAVTPQLLFAKIDEEILFDERTYYLGTNEYRDGTLSPAGFVHLESFCLEEGVPIFTYRLGGIAGILLEKRIWMDQGYNTTFIQYRILSTTNTDKSEYWRSATIGSQSTFERYTASQEFLQQTQCSLTLTLLPFVANRPHNKLQYESSDAHYRVQVCSTEESQLANAHIATERFPKGITGCTIWPGDDADPYHLLAVGHSESQVTFLPTGVWYRNFLHRQDTTTNDPAIDDFYLPGVIRATLWPHGEATVLTVVVSSENLASLPTRRELLSRSYYECLERQQQFTESLLQPQRYFGEAGEAVQALQLRVLPLAKTSNPYEGGKEFLHLLLQASNYFLLQHKSFNDTCNTYSGESLEVFATKDYSTMLIDNYYGLERSTRNALIALPGLLLVTGKYGEALILLKGIAHYFTSGVLPDRLPTQDHPLTDNDYSSADTTLWYFYALDYYLRITHNYEFLEEIFPHLKQCISRYVHGTFNGIRVDQADGLLSAQKSGQAMTWMNAYVDGVPVTPRAGKPVEINALWYHALSLMYEWSQYFSHKRALEYHASYYQELLIQCKHSFQERFWYSAGRYLYDVVDGPEGDDAAIRPNQLFALSLSHPLLDMEYGQQVFDTVTEHLLTPYGLRTLSFRERAYYGHGSRAKASREQQLALHQGCVWSWLIGPYLDTLLRMWPQRQASPLLREYQWRKGLQLLEPFRERFQANLLGTCEGIFDGNQPYEPLLQNPCLASATCIGELLRSYNSLAQLSVPEQQTGTINVF